VIKKVQETGHFLLLLARDFPRRNLLLAALAGTLIVTVYLSPGDNKIQPILIAEPITIALDSAPTVKEENHLQLIWQEHLVGSGDNLSTLSQRAKFSAKDVYKISSSPNGKSLRNLYPGEKLRFGANDTGQLIELHYVKTPLESQVFIRQEDSFVAETRVREPEIILSYGEGVIEDSLYLSGKQSNLPDKLIMEMADIFGWDIDFVFDIRPGDSFALLFEDRFIEGVKLSTGNIVAASFTNRNKRYQAVRYTNKKGQSNYYTPEGLSMRKTFLRTPLDIFRISDGFNLRRKHPIHKKIKAHRGVDYAAPRGTPVYAAGGGKVTEVGYSKYNGNYVFIQHGQTYITKYLHLDKKKVRKGQTVKQRQIIGTVGSTGYSTGSHLHYEFLINGVHRNPRTVTLPQARPIPKTDRLEFDLAVSPVLAQLAEYKAARQLATIQNNTTSAN
jgi:murein DD-endopeptidase MepM/ murein hydrolase activator NlpD